MHQSALVDLPTELILNIFQHLSFDHLLQLAKTCRRLNHIAIQDYMARTGFSNPHKFCVIKPSGAGSMDQLTALGINFSLTVLKQLVCVMSDGFSSYEIMTNRFHVHYSSPPKILTLNMRRINHLVSRLSSIGSIHILVDSMPNNPTLRDAHFYEAVIELAKACVLKSCTSFQISHCRPLRPTWYRFHRIFRLTTAERFKIFLRKFLIRNQEQIPKGDGYRYIRENHPHSSVPIPILPHVPLQSNLTTIDFNPDLFYLPPISTWTFELMKRSPIVCLKLSLINQWMSTDELDLCIFPQISQSVPKLKKIHFASSRGDFFKIFVEHLPSFSLLQNVTFSFLLPDCSFGPSPAPTLSPHSHNRHACPFLARLTCSSYQAAYLLQSSIFFPALRFVNIHMDTYPYIPILGYVTFAKHLTIISRRFSEMDIDPCITLCMDNHQQRPVVPEEIIDTQSDWAKPFNTVSRLTVQGPPSHGTGMLEELEHAFAWLNLFRGVKALTLIRGQSAEETAGENVVIQDRRWTQMLDNIKEKFSDVTVLNIIYLPLETNRYYYRWANSRGDTQMWQGVEIPRMPSYKSYQQSFEDCVCYDI